MIKASELRIGNWVNSTGSLVRGYLQVAGVNVGGLDGIFFGSFALSEGHLEGIPLRPDILEKCGFEKASVPKNYCGDQPVFEKCVNKTADRWLVLAEYGNWLPQIIVDHNNYFSGAAIEAELAFIHQLQNLYFALTGEELEVKL